MQLDSKYMLNINNTNGRETGMLQGISKEAFRKVPKCTIRVPILCRSRAPRLRDLRCQGNFAR